MACVRELVIYFLLLLESSNPGVMLQPDVLIPNACTRQRQSSRHTDLRLIAVIDNANDRRPAPQLRR
jgi:hypothetical protein